MSYMHQNDGPANEFQDCQIQILNVWSSCIVQGVTVCKQIIHWVSGKCFYLAASLTNFLKGFSRGMWPDPSTPLKCNRIPKKRPSQKEQIVFQTPLFRGLHSGELIWQWNVPIFNRSFPECSFHCYVSLPECIWLSFYSFYCRYNSITPDKTSYTICDLNQTKLRSSAQFVFSSLHPTKLTFSTQKGTAVFQEENPSSSPIEQNLRGHSFVLREVYHLK